MGDINVSLTLLITFPIILIYCRNGHVGYLRKERFTWQMRLGSVIHVRNADLNSWSPVVLTGQSFAAVSQWHRNNGILEQKDSMYVESAW